jgi:hypothetical protein
MMLPPRTERSERRRMILCAALDRHGSCAPAEVPKKVKRVELRAHKLIQHAAQLSARLVPYEREFPHLCFPVLIIL